MKMIFMVLLALLILAPVVGLCSLPGLLVDESRAVDAMEAAGYNNVEVTGRWVVIPAIVGCEKSDIVKFDVRAVDSKGTPVKAYTCINMFTLASSSPHFYR